MKYILSLLLLSLSIACFAQHSNGDDFRMWIETKCPAHALRMIVEQEGKLTDSCPALLSKGEKIIYILKEPYFKDMPDSFKGYKINYINADSDAHYWYKKQKEEKIHIYYFSKMFNTDQFYQFWILPVEMKKNKVWYANRGYKCFYIFQSHLNAYEFTRAECFDWDKETNLKTSTFMFR